MKCALSTRSNQNTLTSTNLHKFLRTRRSVRRFQDKAVDGETLEHILQTTVCAPSAHNRQPWRFAVLTAPGLKSRFAEAMAADYAHDLAADGLPQKEIDTRTARSKSRILAAPVIIILCLDMTDMDSYPDQTRQAHEHTMAVQSTAVAGQQLMLACHAEGLGSVWVCSPLFTPQTVRSVLELPETWEPQAMYFIGHPAVQPVMRERKPLKEIIRFL